MKYCCNCGRKLEDNIKFCPVCCAKQPETGRKKGNGNGSGGGKKAGYKTALIISIVAAVFLIALVVAAIFVMLYLKNSNSQDVFSEKEYKAALNAYLEYVEEHMDEYNDEAFFADIVLDANGNPVLVTYENTDESGECNILWYDGKKVASIYEFSGDVEFDTFRMCTDGIFFYSNPEEQPTEYDSVFYQISGGKVNKILETESYYNLKMVIYYEDDEYELDLSDEETYSDENETLIVDFLNSLYGEELVDNVLESYEVFDIILKSELDDTLVYPILSPYYSYTISTLGEFDNDKFEDLINELKDNIINTQKEFYIFKENYNRDNNIYFYPYECNNSIMVMRDITWIYELDYQSKMLKNDDYLDEFLVYYMNFPMSSFGYKKSRLEFFCRSGEIDLYKSKVRVSNDLSNADTIRSACLSALSNVDAYDAMADYINRNGNLIILSDEGIDNLPDEFTTEFLSMIDEDTLEIKNTESGAAYFAIYIDDDMYNIIVYAGNDTNPTAWEIYPELDEAYRTFTVFDEDLELILELYEYMYEYAEWVEIPNLIEEYGSDFESIIVKYQYWMESDDFINTVENVRTRLENGEDIYNDFIGFYDTDYEYDDDENSEELTETETVEVNTEATTNESSIQTETAQESDVKSGISENSESDEYILPDSNSRYLQKSDLEGLTAYELRLARNELFARHGRLFDDKELQAYFDSKSWYNGTISPDDFDDDVFNKYEIANRDLIVEYEQEQGYR